LFVYNDYFILFSDKDNYYLFREINLNNYKPKNLFVVSKDVAKTIEMTRISVSREELKKYNEMCTNKIRNG